MAILDHPSSILDSVTSTLLSNPTMIDTPTQHSSSPATAFLT